MKNELEFMLREAHVAKKKELSAKESPFVPFTQEEKEKLRAEGALIYAIGEETVAEQMQRNDGFWNIRHENEAEYLEVPARRMEVAIFPDPEKFFVPESYMKDKDEQERLLLEDTGILRAKLGFDNSVTQILPEIAEATSVIFKHKDTTGTRLLGEEYSCASIRTNTSHRKDGWDFKLQVGNFFEGRIEGMEIAYSRAVNGQGHTSAARFIVKEKVTEETDPQQRLF
jgi:hypothetical protein